MHFLRRTMPGIALSMALFSFATTVAEGAVTFPSVTGRDLNGRTLQLPKDLAGDVDLLFVAFVRGQQADVDTWNSFADTAKTKYPQLKVYELPVLSRGIGFMRAFIDGGMRNAIADESARASTVTLYIDKPAFRKALDIDTEEQITVLLVKRDGSVLWRAQGRYDAAKAPDLAILIK